MVKIAEAGTLNLAPSPGTDYAGQREVMAAFERDEVFVVQPGEGEWSGRLVTRSRLSAAGFVAAHVAFNSGRSTRRLAV